MRHSGEKRPPTEAHRTGPEGQAASHLSPDRAEALAAKIVAVGSDYITHKTEERFTPSEVSEGPTFMPVDAMANKLMKEAAREMERQEGIVAPGSDAALAQSVFRHKDEPTAPQHIVAEKVSLWTEKLPSTGLFCEYHKGDSCVAGLVARLRHKYFGCRCESGWLRQRSTPCTPRLLGLTRMRGALTTRR